MGSLKVSPWKFDHRTCEVIQSSGRKALGPGRSWKTSREISFIDITWYIKWYITYIYIYYIISTDSHQILHHVVNHSSLIIGYWWILVESCWIRNQPNWFIYEYTPTFAQKHVVPQRVPVRSSEGRPSSSEVRIFVVRPQVTGRSRWNHQKSSEITNHQTSMSNHLNMEESTGNICNMGTLGQHWTTIFPFFFADTCRIRPFHLARTQRSSVLVIFSNSQRAPHRVTETYGTLMDGWDVASSTLLWEEDDEHDSWWHVYLYTIWLFNISMENSPNKWRLMSLGKSSISMGHGFHGYVK